jgi:hypothetical protein
MTKPKKKTTPKLRPAKPQDRVAKHGVYALTELLKGDLDGRLHIAKKRDQLEAQWIERAGGLEHCTPGILSLIRRVVHQELLLSHAEKMALLGRYEPEKNLQARINSQRLNILALENLISANNQSKGRHSLEDYVVEAK